MVRSVVHHHHGPGWEYWKQLRLHPALEDGAVDLRMVVPIARSAVEDKLAAGQEPHLPATVEDHKALPFV